MSSGAELEQAIARTIIDPKAIRTSMTPGTATDRPCEITRVPADRTTGARVRARAVRRFGNPKDKKPRGRSGCPVALVVVRFPWGTVLAVRCGSLAAPLDIASGGRRLAAPPSSSDAGAL